MAGRQLLHLENLGVPLLDRLSFRQDALRILLHQLDVGELADSGLFHCLRMRRILPGVINDQLLGLTRVHPVLEQARGVRIGSAFEDRARSGGERRALLGIN